MQLAKQQLIFWGKMVADCLKAQVSHEVMYQEIREKDDLLAGLDNLPVDQHSRELYFINNSIVGLVGYFERYGTEYIEQL